MKYDPNYLHERDRLIDTPVTLNGKPAKICGKLEPYATVCQYGDNWHIQAMFTWQTVQHVVNNKNGEFKSN